MTCKTLRTSASLAILLDELWLDFKNIARTARAIDLDEPGFIGPYRLPADFVDDLRADRDAIDGKKATATADNLEGLESTKAIDDLLLQGRDEVQRLDAMMQNLYARDSGKLHAWLIASRVERSPKRKPEQPAPAERAPA